MLACARGSPAPIAPLCTCLSTEFGETTTYTLEQSAPIDDFSSDMKFAGQRSPKKLHPTDALASIDLNWRQVCILTPSWRDLCLHQLRPLRLVSTATDGRDLAQPAGARLRSGYRRIPGVVLVVGRAARSGRIRLTEMRRMPWSAFFHITIFAARSSCLSVSSPLRPFAALPPSVPSCAQSSGPSEGISLRANGTRRCVLHFVRFEYTAQLLKAEPRGLTG